MELAVFVLLALIGVGVQGACTSEEFLSVTSCWIDYDAVFIRQFGRSKSGYVCNTDLINSTFCGYYNNFVVCGNGKSLSNTQCRPYIIEEVNNYLVIPCKVENFQAACPNAAKINSELLYTEPDTDDSYFRVPCSTMVLRNGGTESDECGDKCGSERLHGGERLLLVIFCSLLFAKGLTSAF